MTGPIGSSSILAIEPSSRGICFTVFDSKRQLIDWGGRRVRTVKNPVCRAIARNLIRGYHPEFVVLEDADHTSSRRNARIRALISSIALDAREDGYAVVALSRRAVLKRFSLAGISSIDDIAEELCRLYPQLHPRLPLRRRRWESERYSLAVFKAAALGVTFYTNQDDRRTSY